MSAADLALSRIEAVVTEIERLERELGIDVRQPSDKEAFDIVSRIERKMLSAQQVTVAAE